MKLTVGSSILFSVVLCCTGEYSSWSSRGLSVEAPKHRVFENETHCTSGTSFYLACNQCFCPESGIKSGARCHGNGCPPFPPLYDSKTKCTPGKSFKQDCNKCYCSNSGTVGGSPCTLMGCLYKHP